MIQKIKGFENYTISDNGVVVNTKTQLEKKPTSNFAGRGYLYVDLYNNGKKSRKYIHRLVAETFIPNIENKPYINHKDGNPRNNNYTNLEWVTPLENVTHAANILKVMTGYINANNKKKRKVKQVDTETGNVIAIFDSIHEAARVVGAKVPNICNVCNGKNLRCKGYFWQYLEVENEQMLCD